MKINVFYFPVVFETYAAITPDNIRDGESYLIEGDLAEILYNRLNRVNRKAPFQTGLTRLLIEAGNGKPSYLMDTQGNVRRDKDEYQLTPRAFLDINLMLLPKVEESISRRSRAKKYPPSR